jgi:hypothetical protein
MAFVVCGCIRPFIVPGHEKTDASKIPREWTGEPVIVLSDSTRYRLSLSGERTVLEKEEITWYLINHENPPLFKTIVIYDKSELEKRPSTTITAVFPDGQKQELRSSAFNRYPLSKQGVFHYDLYRQNSPDFASFYVLPRYEKGELLRVKTSRVYLHPEYVGFELLKSDFFTLNKVFSIDLPLDSQRYWGIENPERVPMELRSDTAGRRVVQTVTCKRLETIKDGDKMKFPEQSLSSIHFSIPCRYGQPWNWREAGNSFLSGIPGPAGSNQATGDAYRILSERDTMRFVEKVFTYVKDKIRYYQVWQPAYALIPKSPESVLSNGYGDCKDMANLMVCLVRKMNVPCGIALVGTSGEFQLLEHYPGLGLFNHAVVYVKYRGVCRYFDPTNKSATPRTSWYDLLGQKVLLLAKDSSRIDSIASNSLYFDSVVTRNVCRNPASQDKICLAGTISLFGRSAHDLFSDLRSSTDMEQDRYVKEYLSAFFNIKANAAHDSVLSDTCIIITYRSECQDFLSDASQKVLPLRMPGLSRHDPYANAENPGPWFLTEFRQHDTWVFDVKPGNGTMLPDNLSGTLGSGSWNQSANVITRTYEQGTKHMRFEEKEKLLQFHRQRTNFEKATIVF